jgi:hypothetical protein
LALALARRILAEQGFQSKVDAADLVEIGGGHFPKSIATQQMFDE